MKTLIEYLNKYENTAQSELMRFATDADVEALHQLRVSLKKIKAIYRCLQEVGLHKKAQKQYKKFLKPFFADAGVLRQLQLHNLYLHYHFYNNLIQSSKSIKQLPGLIIMFQQQAKVLSKELSRTVKYLLHYSADVKQEQVFEFAVLLKESMYAKAPQISSDGWHEFRKQIKQLIYTYQWLDKKHQLRLLPVSQLQKLDVLQEVIGKWHDAQDMRQWLIHEEFFLHSDPLVKQEFSKAWKLTEKQLGTAEKKLQALLSQITTEKRATLNKNN